jgi:hypothetical protein
LVRCTGLARYASIVKPATTPGKPAIWTRRLLRCGLAAGPITPGKDDVLLLAVILAIENIRDRPETGTY